MVLPEVPVLPGATGSLGGGPGVLVVGQREILVDEAYLARKLRQDLAQHLLDPLAERSLVVGELDDCHRRRRRSSAHDRTDRKRGTRVGRASGPRQQHQCPEYASERNERGQARHTSVTGRTSRPRDLLLVT